MWFFWSDDNNCNWIGFRALKLHSNKMKFEFKYYSSIKIYSVTNIILSAWKLELYFYFCPISRWLWVLLAQKANWNSICSSITASCLLFSCCDCISSPDSTVKPFEGNSSWKQPPCRRDYSFYPHHFFIHVILSLSSCFRGFKKSEDFFSFFPFFFFLFCLTSSFQGL